MMLLFTSRLVKLTSQFQAVIRNCVQALGCAISDNGVPAVGGTVPGGMEKGHADCVIKTIVNKYNRDNFKHFGIFGLKNGCSKIDVKKAYYSLSKLVHPDKNPHPQAKEAMAILSNAYGHLTGKNHHVINSAELEKSYSDLRKTIKELNETLD